MIATALPYDPLEVVEQYGAPLYVYDGDRIQSQYQKLTSAFSVPKLSIHYACKALTNVSILKLIQSLGAGLDAVSIQEVKLGLEAGFAPEHILYTPSGVSLEELSAAVEAGVQINIDNISVLEQFGHTFKDTPVMIRINPHIFAGGHQKISVGHIDSKFGISVHQIPHVLKIVSANQIQVRGLHMHTGSDILDADVFLQGADILLSAAKHFDALEVIDFGSGFKVPYKAEDNETDLSDLGPKLSKKFQEFCQEYGRDLELVFEPGKFLVSQAGRFYAPVNVVKTTPSTLFVGIDTGLNHLIRPMFYDAYHHIENISNPQGRMRIYSIVGYICETDTFGTDRKLSEVREGDLLCFHNAGAYCFQMASNYNSRYRPAEVLHYKGQTHLIRQRESMKDLLRLQPDPNFL